jgi:hypothetical protein
MAADFSASVKDPDNGQGQGQGQGHPISARDPNTANTANLTMGCTPVSVYLISISFR